MDTFFSPMTHDFGTLLAITQANAPSVIQVRSQDILPVKLDNFIQYPSQFTRLDIEKTQIIQAFFA
jgi:hypothetical protein